GFVGTDNDITMMSTSGAMNLYAVYTGNNDCEFSNNKINIGIPSNTSTGASTVYFASTGAQTNVKSNNNILNMLTSGSQTWYCIYSGTNCEARGNKVIMGTPTSTGAKSAYMAYSG